MKVADFVLVNLTPGHQKALPVSTVWACIIPIPLINHLVKKFVTLNERIASFQELQPAVEKS